jgi:hypothetical protein
MTANQEDQSFLFMKIIIIWDTTPYSPLKVNYVSEENIVSMFMVK